MTPSLTAITRAVSPTITDCALSFIERDPIDVERAEAQHRAYEECLRGLSVRVISLPAVPELPDAVFVEDTAVVTDEVAVLTAPRLPSRRREVASMRATLAAYRPLHALDGEACLEGGDVLRIGRTVYVGVSHRSNRAGVDALASRLGPLGYHVLPAEFSGCLHLKTACTFIGRDTLLANPDWVDTTQFGGVEVIATAPGEPEAGNGLLIGDTVVMPASFPATRARLEARGFQVVPVDVTELQKAEAGVTCCSIVFRG